MPNLKTRLTRLSPVGHCAVTALVLGVVLLASLPVAIATVGNAAVPAIILAGAIVFLSAAAGTMFGALLQGNSRGSSNGSNSSGNELLWSVLFGMGARMFFPLLACVVVQLNDGALAAAGFVYFVMLFYLVALVADTWLLLARRETAS
jgi:hypothetical protein